MKVKDDHRSKFVGISKPVKCVMDAGLTTYALSAAHPTLPHNVPLVNNTKETPLGPDL